jgi:quinolinate synthase
MSIPLHPRQTMPKVELLAEINRLRKERNAVILAHYYQDSEIQDLADFVGDSLDLSRKAAATNADVIVFCGVRFMAEVAKILSPKKTVVLPDMFIRRQLPTRRIRQIQSKLSRPYLLNIYQLFRRR